MFRLVNWPYYIHNFIIKGKLIIKKNISLYIIILFCLSCASTKLPKVKIEVDKKIYTFEVAVTNEARQKGLMFRKKLNKNSGMLFVYSQKSYLSFYMKNTFIPLDIAFIDEQHRIINIQQMEPLDETSIVSKKRAQFALEANKGFFNRIGLKVGDKLEFITPIPFVDEL